MRDSWRIDNAKRGGAPPPRPKSWGITYPGILQEAREFVKYALSSVRGKPIPISSTRRGLTECHSQMVPSKEPRNEAIILVKTEDVDLDQRSAAQ